MTGICGRCAHHYEGTERLIREVYKDRADKKGVTREVTITYAEFGGHTSHPNGRCVAPGGPLKGAATGFYGRCALFQQRGGLRPEPSLEQQEISDFAPVA